MKHLYTCLLAGASLLLACGKKQEKQTAENESFPVIELRSRDTLLQKEYVTQIQAIRNVEIRSKVNGYLERVMVDEGQEVSAGQILFLLNSEPYRVALEKALAAVKSAEAESLSARVEVQRVKVLVEKNVISKTELQLAEAKLDVALSKIRQAKAEEADARLHLKYTEIRSPFSGVIDRLPLKLGSLVEEGTLLTTIADVSSVFAYFNLSEAEYLSFMRKRQQDSTGLLELKLADGSQFPVRGKIETMEGQIDAATGSIAFRARFANAGKLLRHGATGRVISTAAVKDALMVPQKSVFEIQDRNYVYIVDGNGKVKMRSFEVGGRVGTYYLVADGLKAGDRIVYEGIQRVKDGATISARLVEPVADVAAMKPAAPNTTTAPL
ncbi:MAG: efflux RND transporter periplasmic adaptor subunit [Chitinophagaceae bacterium]|jgi:membrane fusion protein (multidrug efflux system)|nr:efflux RND transporter periplasmic adaptor subunit [Chitinophagaceae bacterium]